MSLSTMSPQERMDWYRGRQAMASARSVLISEMQKFHKKHIETQTIYKGLDDIDKDLAEISRLMKDFEEKQCALQLPASNSSSDDSSKENSATVDQSGTVSKSSLPLGGAWV